MGDHRPASFNCCPHTRRRAQGANTQGVVTVESLKRPRSVGEKMWVSSIALIALSVVVAPIASIFVASLSSSSGITIQWWSSLGELSSEFARIGSPLDALLLSVSIAVFTALIASLIGGAAAIAVMGRNPLIAVFTLIPLGLSAATVGLGTLLAFGRAPIDLRSGSHRLPAWGQGRRPGGP